MRAGLTCALIVLLVSGCDLRPDSRHQEHEVRKATQAIDTAQTDAERAEGYVARGVALGEKARYSQAFKLIADEEYARLLEMSLKDHERAVALAPDKADMYFRGGYTYFMQAAFSTFDPASDPRSKGYFESAKANFTRAIELDPRHAGAYEFRGLANEGTGDLEQAIADYTQLAALQPRSRHRLADAYCNRGYASLRLKNRIELAIADYERSIEIGSAADGCSCEPYDPLVGIYLNEEPDIGKAREVVRRARASGKRIAREHLEKLERLK